MNKPSLLTYEQIDIISSLADSEWGDDEQVLNKSYCDRMRHINYSILESQRDADYEWHLKQIEEIFEEGEKPCTHYKNPDIGDSSVVITSYTPVKKRNCYDCWQELKSRYLRKGE
jgi:hypothetical protein